MEISKYYLAELKRTLEKIQFNVPWEFQEDIRKNIVVLSRYLEGDE